MTGREDARLALSTDPTDTQAERRGALTRTRAHKTQLRISGDYRDLEFKYIRTSDTDPGVRDTTSSFRYRINVGLSYRFGSIFNNVVNPRLDNF